MFEVMLAKKYIGAQKRHSALTVCSIVIALALITMLFSIFSTAINILRNTAYSQGEYHIQILGTGYGLDKEQYDAVAEAVSEYGTCTAEETMVSGEAVYFANILLKKSIDSADLFTDRIAEEIGVNDLQYYTNETLMLLDVKDAQSGLYMAGIIAAFYVLVLFLIMVLRLIIDTAFEISSKERERQFGVLQSIGATPKQIVRIMTYEGLMLSVIGIPPGTAAGIGLGYLVYRAVLCTGLTDLYLTSSKAAELVHFSVNPWLVLLGVVTGLVWVMLSAYGTGMRVIKMSPVQAISQRGNTVKKVGKAPLFGKMFGWTGKIASRNNMRQPKRFVSTVVSLTLSIALFSAVNVTVNDLRGAAEDYYNEYGARCDFTFYIFSSDDYPFPYRNAFKVEESGLFEDLYYSFESGGWWYAPEAGWATDAGYIRVTVEFCNRNSYELMFDGAPPVSYDELTESGKYIWLSDYFDHGESISIDLLQADQVCYSEEEYNDLPIEEKGKCLPIYNENGVQYYGYIPKVLTDFSVYCDADLKRNGAYLIATIDEYENGAYSLFKPESLGFYDIFCNLTNTDDYYKAVDFIEKNSITYMDNTVEHRQLLALLASVNIVAVFLSVMIALIAVVNMVNILATGILNRRGELAALQCVGMTEKELYRMTALECLQYALTSGIAAVAVCEIMMFLTGKMINIVIKEMEFLGNYISYIHPLPIIGIASLCAFIIAIAASVIPLRTMRRTPLVEQIRNVE